jgi:hypothetical protein
MPSIAETFVEGYVLDIFFLLFPEGLTKFKVNKMKQMNKNRKLKL